MFIKQISIFVENSQGKILPITKALADANIDIRALSVSDTRDFGILRMIVADCDKACSVLREIGCAVAVNEVIGVGVDDTPGGFSKAIEVLNDAQISVEYVYAFISRTENMAYVILRVEDNEIAAKALRDGNIRLITQEDILSM
ncbi:MAG: acetolactate synthase [Oscillospiraceae bacterium]|nr:acetolactate synthase [Oscillospiraceae bacterium]